MSQGYNNWGYNNNCNSCHQEEKKEYFPKCECCSCKYYEKKEEPKEECKEKCATIKVCIKEDKKEEKKDDKKDDCCYLSRLTKASLMCKCLCNICTTYHHLNIIKILHVCFLLSISL